MSTAASFKTKVMDPMVGSSVVNAEAISDSSDNAALLDFCFLCSRQFFHDNLDNYGTERLKDEDVLETFFEELGPVDRALLQCCPSCKALCKTLTRTKEALSSLVDEITNLLLRSRKVSYLLSKSRVVSRLFQSSNVSLPPCEVSSSYLHQPLSQINFPKDISSNNSNNCFPTQFNLRLDSSNISDEVHLDLALSHSNTNNCIAKRPSPFKSQIRSKNGANDCGQEISTTCGSAFASIYNDSMMNSVSDNACDVSEEASLRQQTYKIMSDLTKSLQKTSPNDNISKDKNGLSSISTSIKVIQKVSTALNKLPMLSERFPDNIDNTDNMIDTLEHATLTVSSSNRSENDSIISRSKITQEENSVDILPKAKEKETRFKCILCKKSFQNARNLRNHLSAHREERKYICEMCGVSYRHKVGLDNHVALHKGEPKFKCEFCSKAFSQKIGLQRHLRIHSGKFQFFCDTCGKHFLHHTSFKAHKLIHSGIKNFGCPHCDLTFLQKSNLQRHLKVHSGEKPHDCSWCSRSFSERYNLIAHMKSHENESTAIHKCSLCSKTYTRKFKLKQHLRNIHKIVVS